MNTWWLGDESERFWLEATGRADLGADLNAPQTDERGRGQWSYDLLRKADDGDVVFHYSQSLKSIVAYSFVTGPAWSDQVVWGARGTSASANQVTPYPRAGYRRGLTGYTELPHPIGLEAIRALEPAVMQIRGDLEQKHGSPSYFPFVPYNGGPLRTAQGYMLKMPRALVQLLGLPIPELPDSLLPSQTSELMPLGGPHTAAAPIGAPYRPEDESTAVSLAQPLEIDPAIVERGLRAHRKTQNSLAAWLQEQGTKPLSPAAPDPDWDLAWWLQGTLYVCEVKSLTEANEERQLRMGLGQILRYRHRLGPDAVAVIAVERRPSDSSWLDLLDSLGIHICWPGAWERVLPEPNG